MSLDKLQGMHGNLDPVFLSVSLSQKKLLSIQTEATEGSATKRTGVCRMKCSRNLVR